MLTKADIIKEMRLFKSCVIFYFLAIVLYWPHIGVVVHSHEPDNGIKNITHDLSPSERIGNFKIAHMPQLTAETGVVRKLSGDQGERWKMPYVGGTRFLQSQGYYGSFSHGGVKALDMIAQEGIVAATKSGKISTVNYGGKWDGWCNSNSDCIAKGGIWRGNHIIISHDDGSQSYYLHLKPGSIPQDLWLGKEVQQGTAIGIQGFTGYTCGDMNNPCGSPYSHLHFQVNKSGMTIDTPFEDCDVYGNQCLSGIPVEGKYYISANWGTSSTGGSNPYNNTFNLYGSDKVVRLKSLQKGSTLILDKSDGVSGAGWAWLGNGEIRGYDNMCLQRVVDLIVINSCDGTNSQKWDRGPRNSIKSRESGQCIDSERGDSTGSKIYLSNCHNGYNQQWRYANEPYPLELQFQNYE